MSWEKSCYDAVVQLYTLLEGDRFVFANIISIMKQLDLGKQRKTLTPAEQLAETTRVPVQPAANSLATRQTTHEQHQEPGESKDRPVESSSVPKDEPTIRAASQREAHRAAEKERTRIVGELTCAPIDNDGNKDSPEQEGIVNRATLPFPVYGAADGSSSNASPRDTVTKSPSDSANLVSVSQLYHLNRMETSSLPQSISQGSVTDDPLFYVCTSFARTSSHKTTVPSSCESPVLESNYDISSVPATQLLSFRSSQSFPYHDYCLSEREFEITPPVQTTQSTPSEVARKSARAKEAEIFRQIEGDAFDEKAFFNSTQVPLWINLTNDDDVTMLPA